MFLISFDTYSVIISTFVKSLLCLSVCLYLLSRKLHYISHSLSHFLGVSSLMPQSSHNLICYFWYFNMRWQRFLILDVHWDINWVSTFCGLHISLRFLTQQVFLGYVVSFAVREIEKFAVDRFASLLKNFVKPLTLTSLFDGGNTFEDFTWDLRVAEGSERVSHQELILNLVVFSASTNEAVIKVRI